MGVQMRPVLSCVAVDADVGCAIAIVGAPGVLASPFGALHGISTPLTAALGGSPMGGTVYALISNPRHYTHTRPWLGGGRSVERAPPDQLD